MRWVTSKTWFVVPYQAVKRPSQYISQFADTDLVLQRPALATDQHVLLVETGDPA